jgi:putative Holliday junction resolvase
MRYLAVDLGDRRTGLAIGDDELKMAQPVCVLEVSIGPRLVEKIITSLRDQDAQALVIGLPLNMDGSAGGRVDITNTFADQLRQKTDVPIHFQDERLTSAAAEERLAQSGKTHKQKKKLRDALAAVEFLNDFLATVPKRTI